MRILVCGSREYDSWEYINAELSRFKERNKITEIIHGGAAGVDSFAGLFARRNDVKETVFMADWDKYGKAAGPIRNKQMLDEGKPDLVIAFPTEKSKGTRNMIEQAEKAGVDVIVYDV